MPSKVIRFQRCLADEASADIAFPQERLVGERVVVKEIAIIGDLSLQQLFLMGAI